MLGFIAIKHNSKSIAQNFVLVIKFTAFKKKLLKVNVKATSQ